MSDVSELDLRRERAAKNQSLFREVNDRIEDLADGAALPMFICECLDRSCDASVSITVDEYEQVRAHSNRFLVLPGHEVPDIEEVVERSDRFLIVAKLGVGARVAEEFDPRGRLKAAPS